MVTAQSSDTVEDIGSEPSRREEEPVKISQEGGPVFQRLLCLGGSGDAGGFH